MPVEFVSFNLQKHFVPLHIALQPMHFISFSVATKRCRMYPTKIQNSASIVTAKTQIPLLKYSDPSRILCGLATANITHRRTGGWNGEHRRVNVCITPIKIDRGRNRELDENSDVSCYFCPIT